MPRPLLSLFLTTLSLFACCISARAQTPTLLWNYRFGGSNSDALQAVQQTSDGGYILGGTSNSSVSGDKSQPSQAISADYWLVKLDASGTKVWDRTLGGSGAEELGALIQTSDGGYLLGGYSSSGSSGDKTQLSQGDADYWVVKLDANGNKVWDRSFGGTGFDGLYAVQQTSDGGYMVGGYSNSPISGDKTQANRGAADYWIVKLDGSGVKQWDRSFGSNEIDQLWTLQQTSDGGYILGGTSYSGAGGDKTQANQGRPFSADYWILKLDVTGTKQWDRTFGGISHDYLRGVQQTSDGGFVVGGHSESGQTGSKSQVNQGLYDYWVLKLDATGTKVWDRSLGGSAYNYLQALQLTPDGGYLLAGSSTSGISGDKTQASRGERDYWFVKLDATGGKSWDKTVGGNRADDLAAVQLTSDGNYIAGGTSLSALSGDKTQASRGDTDYWVVKLSTAPLATTVAAPRPTLLAYPNPANTQITLHGLLGTPYQLLNQLGQVVRVGQLSAQPLDLQTLPAGLYLLRDQTNGYTTKLVKE